MLQELEYGAKNLHAHFHAVCKGNIPLLMDWNEEAQKAAEVDEKSLEFLKRLRNIVQSRGKAPILFACCYNATPLPPPAPRYPTEKERLTRWWVAPSCGTQHARQKPSGNSAGLDIGAFSRADVVGGSKLALCSVVTRGIDTRETTRGLVHVWGYEMMIWTIWLGLKKKGIASWEPNRIFHLLRLLLLLQIDYWPVLDQIKKNLP